MADTSLGGICGIWAALDKAGCLGKDGRVSLLELMGKSKNDPRLQKALGLKEDPGTMRLFVQALRGAMTTGQKTVDWEEFARCLGEVGFGEYTEYYAEDIHNWVHELQSLLQDGLEDVTCLLEQLLQQ